MGQPLDQVVDTEKAVELYRSWCERNIKNYVAPDLNKTESGIYRGKQVVILRASKGYKLAIIGVSKKGLGVLWGNSFATRPQVSQRGTRLLDNEWVLAVN